MNAVVSLGVVTVLFAMIFKFLPDAQPVVAWKDVWIGAFMTAILFTIGKVAIGLYLGRGTVGSAYGAAGSLLVILVWVYYAAQILFFGAELTQVYASRHGSRKAAPEAAEAAARAKAAARLAERPAPVSGRGDRLEDGAGGRAERGPGRDDRRRHAVPRAGQEGLTVELVLYVSGQVPASARARQNLQRLLASHGGPDVRVEIRDVAEDVDAAERDHVVFTPTLIVRAGGVETRAVGDLADGSALTGILALGRTEKTG